MARDVGKAVRLHSISEAPSTGSLSERTGMLIENQAYLNVKGIGSHRTFADLELVRSEFTGSNLSQFDDPAFSLVVRDVTIRRCVAKRSSMSGVRLEDVMVDGLTGSQISLECCVFRHVTIRGRVTRTMLLPPNFSLSEERQSAFAAGALAYYADVDWALDISEAEFDGADLYYLPGSLVRRDPATQFLVRRSTVAEGDTSELPNFARIAIERLEATPFDSVIAVAPKRSKRFADIKAQLEELRDRKLAE